MEKKLEVSTAAITENSMTGVPDTITGVPSATSYNNDHQSVIHSDAGSVASGSLPATGTISSPQRSPQKSNPTSPASAAGSNATPLSFQQQRSVDLLDNANNATNPASSASDPYSHGYPATRDRSGLTASDDDHTEPSSSATGTSGNNMNPAGYTRSDLSASATSTFGRMIENTKKRLNSTDRRRSSGDGDNADADDDDDDEEEDLLDSALIYGYLQKLGRNGKWQTRWFETDGECLTYYKSSKRTKLLATLDLAKVGSIVINHQDRNGATFTINISERPYHLRADSMAACKDWVITLNRVKEARMHEGNVKLAIPSHQPPDLLDHDYTPRVVVVANRERTRAVDDVEEIQSWEHHAEWNQNKNNNPANNNGRNNNYLATSSGRLARWQKPRHTFSRLATKLAKWARSIRKYGCADAENHVVLDHHLHPPGHDDKKQKRVSNSSPSGSKSGAPDVLPADRPANHAVDDAPLPQDVQDGEEDDDDDIRYLS